MPRPRKPLVQRLDGTLDGGGLAALARTRPDRYPFLLQSVASGTARGRYDLLLAFPGERLTLSRDRDLEGPHADAGDFLTGLDRWFLDEQRPRPEGVPFAGGWFLYLGYELAGEVEPCLDLAPAEEPLPAATAVRVPAALIRDTATGALWWATEDPEGAPMAAVEADIARPAVAEGPFRLEALEEDPADRYLEAVARARRYIRDGDIFQANLARTWRGRLGPETGADALYTHLSRANPGPFAGLARLEEATVISSSPERLLALAGNRASMRPIAGTRPRGEGAGDAALRAELESHPKERAEHIMLVDLIRNDLGRICRPGSVTVDELMTLEEYAHVHHIVSEVGGELTRGTGPGEAIRATFPGGTITGCPKVRCMEIIAELEGGGRGAYTGSMGYLDAGGDLDLNILIRTLVQYGEHVTLRAGAGIVADSEPEAELAETRAKARGLLAALEGGGA
ncbi:aminodeoxychorismate synthase component I [Thiohalospira sp.]|uniref:aminodeoxychorismate synthase component I n=1 Tax=Thiohalospira sp. TaxID=3080549 RepID=UPI0039817724